MRHANGSIFNCTGDFFEHLTKDHSFKVFFRLQRNDSGPMPVFAYDFHFGKKMQVLLSHSRPINLQMTIIVQKILRPDSNLKSKFLRVRFSQQSTHCYDDSRSQTLKSISLFNYKLILGNNSIPFHSLWKQSHSPHKSEEPTSKRRSNTYPPMDRFSPRSREQRRLPFHQESSLQTTRKFRFS